MFKIIQDRYFKAAGAYSFVIYLGQAFNVFVQIFIRRVLDPQEMGYFAFVKLLYNYLDLGHFGIRFGVDRELPLCTETGCYSLESTAYSLFFLLAPSITIASFIIVFFLYHDTIEVWLAFLVLDLSALWLSFANFKKAIFRAKEKTEALIFFAAIQPFLNGLFVVVGLHFWGYWGLVGGFFFANTTTFFLFRSKYKTTHQLQRPDKAISKKLFRSGLPMLLNAFLGLLSNSIDRWVVLVFFGVETLGIYSTAGMFMAFAMLLPNSISEIFFPQIIRKSNEEPSVFINFFKVLTFKLVSLNLAVAALGALFIPTVINLFIPKYTSATTASIILIFVTGPNMLISLCSYALVGYMKQHWIIILNTISIFSSVLLSFLLKNYGISGMASALLLSKIFISVCYYRLVIQSSP